MIFEYLETGDPTSLKKSTVVINLDLIREKQPQYGFPCGEN